LARNEAAFHPVGIRILALCRESGEAADFYRYGRALLHGFRCVPDETEGMAWLRRAADLGHGGAAAELNRTGAIPVG
jgi:TPR repeat protein